AAEAERLAAVLPRHRFVIEHIGSTAVQGLAAKPIIDIMVGADSLNELERHIELIVGQGYRYVPEHEAALPERRFFVRSDSMHRVYHIHAVARSTPFWLKHLAFRDALRANAELAARYAALKRQLATRFEHDRESYTDAKAPFIQAVLAGLAL